MSRLRSYVVMVAALAALAACTPPDATPGVQPPGPAPVPGTPTPTQSATPTVTPAVTPSARPTPTPSASPSASPPPSAPTWLGTRPLPRRADGYGEAQATPAELDPRGFTLPDTVAELPGTGFASRVSAVPADVLARSTWQASCPVSAAQLAYVRLAFWGFDAQRHTGELLINAAVADDVVSVFRQLYRARFPIEQMQITTRAELEAAPTGDGNDTESFVCRPSTGSTTTFSQHAYGLAIDVDPFQNPYVKGDLVLPELASTYLQRDDVRPGMITPDGPVVRAFASVGWTWGGSWSSLKDYQHFSQNGR